MSLVLLVSLLAGVVLTILESSEGVERELPLDSRDRIESFRETESFPSGTSSSLRDPSTDVSNIGVEDELLPDTVLAMESFLRWLMIGVILLLNLDSFLSLEGAEPG